MNKNTISCIIAILAIFLFTSQALSEYNSEKLAQSIGGYLTATDMFEKVTKSECGYVVKKKYSLISAVDEVMPYLRKQDRKEIESFLKNEIFIKQLEDNNKFLSGFMQAGAKDGLDKKTLCGMLVSTISLVYQKSVADWNYAKTYYLK